MCQLKGVLVVMAAGIPLPAEKVGSNFQVPLSLTSKRRNGMDSCSSILLLSVLSLGHPFPGVQSCYVTHMEGRIAPGEQHLWSWLE